MNKMLSVILLSYYSKERIERSYLKIRDILDGNQIPFEFIVMDDGSLDEFYVMALELEKKYPDFHAYQLSRNYGCNYSLFAGLSVCRGACAMTMVDDEQQPFQTLVDMYRLWEQGHKIIIPYRVSLDDPSASKFFSRAYYSLMTRFSLVKYPPDGADLFFIDRKIIDILNTRIHPINTSAILEMLRLGFDPVYYPYERPLGLNQNKSRWTFRKKLRMAKDTFFSASTFPIQCISFLGGAAFIFSIIGRVRNRDEVQQKLKASGIPTMIHYRIPPHLSDAYADMEFKRGDFPIAVEMADTFLSLLIGPHIPESDVKPVISAVRTAVRNE